MKSIRSVTFILLLLSFLSINKGSAQLKGRLKYDALMVHELWLGKPCVLIKSVIPDLEFSWSGEKIPNIERREGNWYLTLREGPQTLIVYAHDFESLDVPLDLRRNRIEGYEIIPIIEQYYLRVETEPDSAEITLIDLNGPKILDYSPFNFNPHKGKYMLQISYPKYKTIDTTIVLENVPIIKLKFILDKINTKKDNEKKKLPKIAVRVMKTNPNDLSLEDSIYNKINDHVLLYYKNHNKLLLLPLKMSEDIFKKIDDGKIPNEKQAVNFILDCNLFMKFGNMIQIDAKLYDINKNNIEDTSFTDYSNNFMPTKTNLALAFIDSMMIDRLNIFQKLLSFFSSERGIGIASTTVITAILFHDTFCNKREREKLPPAPGFPKPK